MGEGDPFVGVDFLPGASNVASAAIGYRLEDASEFMRSNLNSLAILVVAHESNGSSFDSPDVMISWDSTLLVVESLQLF